MGAGGGDSGVPDAGPGPDDGGVPDAGPPGMPTVTPIPEFDSEIFRQWAALVELTDGRVFVAGGLIVRGPPGGGPGRTTGREEIELFDVAKRSYREVAPLNEGRARASAVLLPDGKVLITGGTGGPPGETGMRRASAELFDPATNETTLLPEAMNTARAGHGSWLLSSGVHAGKVLIAGGATTNAPELYDPATGTFTLLGATNAPSDAAGIAVLLDDQQVLFIGATNEFDTKLEQSYFRYDPATGVFDELGLFTMAARSRYTMTNLHDGRVLIAGGYTDDLGGLASLDVFDPSDNSLGPTGQTLGGARYSQSAAVLPSGRVALFSGFSMPGVDGALSTVAIWDPSDGTVEDAAGEVSVGRSNSQALALSSGVIFVIGGQVTIGGGNTAIVPNVDIISE